ncbi:MAG: hypothetical protein L0Z50_33690 [Verrucomicrobiales bacterium]|nr:hypothetical protein [Verrucomicrobiales bacterium]
METKTMPETLIDDAWLDARWLRQAKGETDGTVGLTKGSDARYKLIEIDDVSHVLDPDRQGVDAETLARALAFQAAVDKAHEAITDAVCEASIAIEAARQGGGIERVIMYMRKMSLIVLNTARAKLLGGEPMEVETTMGADETKEIKTMTEARKARMNAFASKIQDLLTRYSTNPTYRIGDLRADLKCYSVNSYLAKDDIDAALRGMGAPPQLVDLAREIIADFLETAAAQAREVARFREADRNGRGDPSRPHDQTDSRLA